MLHRYVVGIVFAMNLAATATARADAPMTLPDAVAYAETHAPGVAEKLAAARSAEHALAQARDTAFPVVAGELSNTVSKSSNYEGQYGIIGTAQQATYSQNTAQLGTNYTLTTGGLSFYQLAAAKAAAAQADEQLAQAEDDVATSVTNAYFTVVQRRAIVDVDRSDLTYQKTLVSAAQAKARAGVVAEVDVFRAQVAQAKSNSTLIGAQADVEGGRELLAQAVGIGIDQTFIFPPSVPMPPMPAQTAEQLMRVAETSRPDVLAAMDAVAAAKATRKGWDRELYPTVAIGAALGNQFSPTTQQYGPNLEPLPRAGSPGFWLLSATSTFTLPLVDYGARHTERVADDAALTSNAMLYDQARTQADIDVSQSYRGAQTALAQLGYARQEASLGIESARIARLQYQHGIIALADVIQSQQQSVIAQSDLVNAQVAYVEALVKLRASLGIYDAKSAVADL